MSCDTKRLENNLKKEVMCTKPGNICYDCWTSLFCIQVGEDFYEDFQYCPTGTTCVNSTGQCGVSTHYECDGDYLFSYCHGLGIFPDPFNCKKYFMCDSDLDKASGECRGGYAFNPSTYRCDRKLKDMNQCLSPVPICHSLSQMGPVEGSPGIFYRCNREYLGDDYHFYPELYACPDNQHFNGNICVETTPDVEDQFGNCLKEGLFYHPDNCAWYRECAAKGVSPVNRICPENNKFDPIKGNCIPFSCTNCHI